MGLSLGSRWVPGGAVVDWPASRERISRVGNAYARWMLRLPIRDLTAGFRAFRRAALVEALETPVVSRGYCFQIDLAWRAERLGLKIVEVPITFVEREEGASKMSNDVTVEAATSVAKWGLTARARTLAGKLGLGR